MTIISICLLVLVIGLISWFSEKDEPHPIGSIFVIAGALTIYHFVVKPFDYHLFLQWCQQYSSILLIGTGIWIIAGVIWSFIKWFFYLGEVKTIQDLNFVRLVEKWRNSSKTTIGPVLIYVIPNAAEEKERIITWMIYWPFSILATLCSNWVYRLFQHIFNTISGTFDKMAKSRFS